MRAFKTLLLITTLIGLTKANAQVGVDQYGQLISSSSTGTALKVTQVQGADQHVSTMAQMYALLPSQRTAYMTCYVLETNTVYRLGSDLLTWTADNSYDSRYRPSSYVPSWDEVTSKPAFKTVATTGSYNDLSDLPTLFNGDYNNLSNRPTLFNGDYNSLSNKPILSAVAGSGSYGDLLNKPDIPSSLSWFGTKLLTNIGATSFPITNSASGTQLYIATNYSNGYNEVDYFSIPGTINSSRGHHDFYTLNPIGGTGGGMVFDFGTVGDNNAFTTGGPLAPNVVDHLNSTPNRIAVFDNVTNTILYRTPSEIAADIGSGSGASIPTPLPAASTRSVLATDGTNLIWKPKFSGVPTISSTGGLGTGGSVSISGYNETGEITLHTGSSGMAAGAMAGITFGGSFAYSTMIVILSVSAATPNNWPSTVVMSGNGLSGNWTFTVSTALPANQTYKINYIVESY